MSWIQIHIDTSSARAEQVEELLLALGSESVTLSDQQDQPILEPGVGETPLWRAVRVTGLFPQHNDQAAIRQQILAELNIATDQCTTEIVADRAWEREWLKHYQPIQCGQRLRVCPQWQQVPKGNTIDLLLDPGLAFGTGTHETTMLCLQWLDAANLHDKVVLDFGCGSGILGIAALLLGARQTVFVDIDPQARTATLANLEKNSVAPSRYQIYASDEFQASAQFDLVLANILAKPLIELAPNILKCLTTDGQLVLSGLQPEQATAVIEAYSHSVVFSAPEILNGWIRLNGQFTEGCRP